VGEALRAMLGELEGTDRASLRADRRDKFLEMGARGLAG
jgi:acetyl-CoA carboxylase carboxyl transferase subunit alpha